MNAELRVNVYGDENLASAGGDFADRLDTNPISPELAGGLHELFHSAEERYLANKKENKRRRELAELEDTDR